MAVAGWWLVEPTTFLVIFHYFLVVVIFCANVKDFYQCLWCQKRGYYHIWLFFFLSNKIYGTDQIKCSLYGEG